MRVKFIAPAVLVAASLAAGVPAAASAAPAHSGRIVVSVTWRDHHATEIVRVTSDPAQRRVQALGICDQSGLLSFVRGRALHGDGVTRVHCSEGGTWDTAGWVGGQGRYATYHSERGTKGLA